MSIYRICTLFCACSMQNIPALLKPTIILPTTIISASFVNTGYKKAKEAFLQTGFFVDDIQNLFRSRCIGRYKIHTRHCAWRLLGAVSFIALARATGSTIPPLSMAALMAAVIGSSVKQRNSHT